MLLSPVIISGVHPNPRGEDLAAHNGEFVVLHSFVDDVVNVGGWAVRDAKDHVLSIPAGTTIAPRGQLRVYTGPGVNAPGRVYIGRRSPIFNNREPETVQLLSDGSSVRHTFTYDPR